MFARYPLPAHERGTVAIHTLTSVIAMHTAEASTVAAPTPFTDRDAARVWNYWFARRDSADTLRTAVDPSADGYVMNHALWFHGGPDVDAAIRERFEALVARASRGELDAWASTPRGAVALVVALDQLPRNMYRGTARAFACDAHALVVAREAIDRGFDRAVSPAEAMFLFTALTHSEDVADVRRAVAGLDALVTRCAPSQQRAARTWKSAALKHQHLLERFGRYPHRNELLGRESTPEEVAFLARPDFGAVFMRSQRPRAEAPAKPASAPVETSSSVAPTRKLRVLALHGFRQNGAVFRARTAKMRRALSDLADFVFVTAPMRYEPRGETRDATLSAFGALPDYPMQQVWWLSSEDNCEYEGFDASVAFLEEVFRTQGPFDGVIGFAQGGTLAAVLAAMQPHPVIAPRFVVCVSAFSSRAEAHASFVTPGRIALPSLHVLGENDILVTPDRSERLFATFDARTSQLARHGGGHFTPSAWPYDTLRAFFERFVDRSAVPSEETHDAPYEDLRGAAFEALAMTPVNTAALDHLIDEMASRSQWGELVEVCVRSAELRAQRDDHAFDEAHRGVVEAFARHLSHDLCAWTGAVAPARLDRALVDGRARREPAPGGAWPSRCARFAPRIGAHADRVCRLARDIATELFSLDEMADAIAEMERDRTARLPVEGPAPADRRKGRQSLDATTQARKLSYQRYGQLLSLLRGAIERTDPAHAHAEVSRLRRSRTHSPELIAAHADEPISMQVLDPEPEPVVPCAVDDLAPLFRWLESNVEVEEQTAFRKGTMTTDGRLDLCKQVVGPEGIGPLLGAMRRTERVKRLLLGNNIVGDGGAAAIARFLREREDSPLTCWYIAGNHIGPAGIAEVCEALADDPRVTALWLKRNPLKAAGMAPIAAMLRANRAIEVLDLVNCGLLDEGLATLLGSLMGPGANKTLRHLYVGTNGVTARSAPLLGGYLAEDCALESLYLSCNRLGDDGAEAVARGLAANRTLRRVSLASNRIGPRGAEALARALAEHPTVALFDLGFTRATASVGERGNYVGDEGARALAAMLARNTALRVLDLLHNYVSQVGVNHLREALKVNRTLTGLQLTQFGRVHNEPGKEELRAALSRNQALVPERDCEAVQRLELPDHITEIYSVYRTRD